MKKLIFLLLLSSICVAQTTILPNGNETIVSGAGAIIDNKNQNNGTLDKGIRFGSSSGEGIGSRRILGANHNGLDFYTSYTKRLSINNGGFVGIGTDNPQMKLQINDGGIALYYANDNKSWEFDYDHTNDYFFVDEFGSGRRLVIKNGGNVGIGTTNPTAKLEVDGFTKLGSDAPKIKVKKLTTTMGANQGDAKLIPHGLSPSKILSTSILVEFVTDNFVPANYTNVSGYEFQYFINGGDVKVIAMAGNSSQIINKNIKVLITYEE
jgi:phage pi2 protein 07